jgi:hypothetical protein
VAVGQLLAGGLDPRGPVSARTSGSAWLDRRMSSWTHGTY